jgi:hypothetical protein
VFVAERARSASTRSALDVALRDRNVARRRRGAPRGERVSRPSRERAERRARPGGGLRLSSSDRPEGDVAPHDVHATRTRVVAFAAACGASAARVAQPPCAQSSIARE